MFEYPDYINKSKIFNLKKQNPILKGDIGEVIVKNRVNWCHRTRELSSTFLDAPKNIEIGEKFKNFLKKHWFTIDLFRFVIENNKVVDLEIYEVKTRSMVNKSYNLYPKPGLTSNAMAVYKEALELGFKVKYAEVQLYDNWEYYINFRNFRPQDFMIHDGNLYFAQKKNTASRVQI